MKEKKKREAIDNALDYNLNITLYRIKFTPNLIMGITPTCESYLKTKPDLIQYHWKMQPQIPNGCSSDWTN